MSAILALARKDLTLMFRDRFALFWIFAFPLMFALFFGSIFGGGGGGARGELRVAVVDEDGSDSSRALAAALGDSQSLELVEVRVDAEEGAPATRPHTLEEAREGVRKGRMAAYIHIPAGYGDNPYALFSGGSTDQATLEIGIDPGRQAEAGFLQGLLMESIFSSLQERITDPALLKADLSGARAELAEAADVSVADKLVLGTFFGALETFVEDFDVEQIGTGEGRAAGMEAPFEIVGVARDRTGEPRSAFDVTFPQALVWGMMSVALAFAITLVREREKGTLVRLRMAPLGRAELLAGKAVACFAGCMITMVVISLFGALALGVRYDSLPLTLLAMLCTSACFTGLMMTISVLGKTEAAVAGGSWGLMMPFAMVGGGMIPLMTMPSWLQELSVVSPFRWAITAIEGAAWRGYTLEDQLLPCAVLLAIGVVFFSLGVLVFRRIEG